MSFVDLLALAGGSYIALTVLIATLLKLTNL